MTGAPPYQLYDRDLALRAAELRLAELVGDVYLDPAATLARAALDSSLLIATVDHSTVTGFLLVKLLAMTRGRTACRVMAHGVADAFRGAGIATGLLGVLDPRVAVIAATTAHESVARGWRRHFAARVIDPRDHGELARELWQRIGVRQGDDPSVCRGAFAYEYTASELALIGRLNRTLCGRCRELDADAGDRVLLIARRS